MLRLRWKPEFLFLAVFTLTMGCNGKATNQSVTALPSVTFTTIKPSGTPIPLSDLSNPSTTTGTPIIPTPTVDLPFEIVRLPPNSGILSTLLMAEAQKAYAMGYKPVVEFDAPW
jgi:hypothetical protein